MLDARLRHSCKSCNVAPKQEQHGLATRSAQAHHLESQPIQSHLERACYRVFGIGVSKNQKAPSLHNKESAFESRHIRISQDHHVIPRSLHSASFIFHCMRAFGFRFGFGHVSTFFGFAVVFRARTMVGL
jgi:hypothetical protein